jgi:microcystin-dependent protein
MKKAILYILFLTSVPLFAQELPLVVQGVLKSSEGTALPEGTYSLTFKLYLSNEGDAQAIWTETQPNVRLKDGAYSVVLGSVTPLRLPFDRPYFLGVSLGDGAEFIPRSELTAAPSALFASRGGGGAEPGMIAPFAGYLGKVPYGWMPCDGRALKSTEYPSLFAVIGAIYGNGSSGAGAGGGTDFNLPNLNGQFLRGVNAGRLPGPDQALGSREGYATGLPSNPIQATTNSAGAHSHGGAGFPGLQFSATGKGTGTPSTQITISISKETSSIESHSHGGSVIGGGDNETRPRNSALIYCIKF